jgi:2-oxoisovalerate dehydrogenase E2 component (dihydrolipoyl transacylase)
MSRYVFKMPDLGEGTVAAEIVACHVKPGDVVKEEQVILEVMTEKAAVEINSPVSGRIVSIAGQPGNSIPVGAELIVFDTADAAVDATANAIGAVAGASHAAAEAKHAAPVQPAAAQNRDRVMASPATRRRAREAGVELSTVPGSGPGGRIERDDLARFLATREQREAQPAAKQDHDSKRSPVAAAPNEVEEVPIIGLRRLIAQRMSEAVRTIPHFSYVEEIDVTELEALRRHLNSKQENGPSLTYLPFLALALARVLPQFPNCNARYDAQREMLLQHRSLHLGIATQTSSGLKVPVVRNAERRSLYEIAAEIRRVSEAARTGKASREELSGSTLTLTSLGKLGGIASTPIINAPEVAIIGVNKAVDRPVVQHGAIVVRRMMNLSGSFDHRFVDGHDAASLVQALKEAIEHPALIFAPTPSDERLLRVPARSQ